MSSRNRNQGYNAELRLMQTISMGAQIAKKDADYAHYSGAYIEDAMVMAKLDFFMRTSQVPEGMMLVMVKAIRYYLDLKRKAYFSSLGSDIFTKLAFILGDNRKEAIWKMPQNTAPTQ